MHEEIKKLVKKDIEDAVTDVFEPTELSYEIEGDKLIATLFDNQGNEIDRFEVGIVLDLRRL